jgi:hypothetical protein
MEFMLNELNTIAVQSQFAKSEKALFNVLDFKITYEKYAFVQAYTDAPELFEEAMTVGEHQVESYAFQLAQTLKGDPKRFIVTLAKEDAQVQEKVLFFWQYISYTEELAWVVWDILLEEDARAIKHDSYFSDEEFEVLHSLSIACHPTSAPFCIDPDPEELEQWLLEKYPPVEIPTDVPVQTLPATTPTEESEPRKEENSMPTAANDPNWISTVCFILAAFAAGIAVGGLLRKKPKEAAAQAPAAPVVTYPMRVYCPAPLEKETVEQITIALREKHQEYSIDWYSVKNPSGTCRCYGTDRGADIVFYAGGFRLEIPDSRTVAEATFHFGTAFELYLHKDGILTDLEEAYQNGLVSQNAIAAACQMHNNTYKEDTL